MVMVMSVVRESTWEDLVQVVLSKVSIENALSLLYTELLQRVLFVLYSYQPVTRSQVTTAFAVDHAIDIYSGTTNGLLGIKIIQC